MKDKQRIRCVSVLKKRGFTAFWAGHLAFRLADNFFTIGLFWWILEATNSEALLGYVATLNFLPMFIFSVFSGVIADSLDRRRVLVASALARGFLVPLIPLFYYLQVLEVWHIYVIGFLQGVSSSFFIVASSAITPQLVSKEELMAANSLVDASSWSANIVGFLIGGVLVVVLGAMKVLALTPFLLVPSAIFIALIHVELKKTNSSGSVRGALADVVAGFRTIRNDAAVFAFIVTWAGIQMLFAGGPMSIGLPIFSNRILNAGAEGYGLLVAMLSVSSLLGSVFVGELGSSKRKGHLILLGFTWAAIGMFAFSLTSSFLVALVVISLWNVCFPLINIPFTTAIQERVSGGELGKVFGLTNMLASAMTPVSLVMTGFIMERSSVVVPFQLFAASFAVCFVIVFAVKEARNAE